MLIVFEIFLLKSQIRFGGGGCRKKANAYLPNQRADMRLLYLFWRKSHTAGICEVWLRSDKTGVSKGYPFGTQLCRAKCSVLSLLARLAGKMSVSPDGNARFARQENGQVFANGDVQKLGRFQKW